MSTRSGQTVGNLADRSAYAHWYFSFSSPYKSGNRNAALLGLSGLYSLWSGVVAEMVCCVCGYAESEDTQHLADARLRHGPPDVGGRTTCRVWGEVADGSLIIERALDDDHYLADTTADGFKREHWITQVAEYRADYSYIEEPERVRQVVDIAVINLRL